MLPNRVALTYTGHDIDTLARTIFGEARGESWEGKVAVGWSIRNRAEFDLHDDGKPDWWGEEIAGVALRPWQYSSWNQNDPNRAKMLAATPADPVFRECLAAAAWVLGDKSADPTRGSANYQVIGTNAAWSRNHVPVVTIGHHEFFNDIEN